MEVVKIEFNHTDCGVPFLVNSGKGEFLRSYLYSEHLHTTDFFELYFFYEDTGFVEVDGERIVLRAGTVLFLSPAHRRRWEVEHLRFDFLLFVEGFLSSFLQDKFFVHRLQYCFQYTHPLTLTLELDQVQHFARLLAEVREELRHINRDSEMLLSAQLSYMLLHLNRLYCSAYGLPHVSLPDTVAFQFKVLLEEFVQREQRVDFYADRLRLSRVALDKALKTQFGMTASELIKRRLLVELKNALRYEHRAVKELAYELGFSEPNHLMRFFKRMTGMTIGDYLSVYKSGSN